MKEKLEFLLKNKGLTATSLARLLEIQPSGLSHILSGRNKPSFDLVVKILKAFPDINPDWLLLDSSEIFRGDASSTTTPQREFVNVAPAAPSLPFDAPQNNEFSEPEKIQENDFAPIFSTPKSAGKKVSRVIVLYADRTFESFTEF
jgi:transcriptional regulator with XRE-family HTH domain